MNSRFYIASRLSKINITPEDLSQVKEYLVSITEDEESQLEFFSYCRKWKLAPWIWCQLNKHNLESLLSNKVLNAFKEFYTGILTENTNRNKEALRFLKEFNSRDIVVAVLKGNHFMHSLFKDVGYKKMNDFDMLIRASDWPGVQEVYFDLGYIPLGFGWGGEKQEAAKFSHAGMSFISPDYRCITGTQWGLKSPTSKYNKDIIADIWDKTSDLSYYDINVKQLSPEYNLLHLVLHMGVYKCGIRDCMDVFNLYDKGINEDELLRIIRMANACGKAYFTLKMANLCSDLISQDLIDTLRQESKGFLVRRTESRIKMAKRTGDMQLSYNDYFHDVEMNVFYFNLYAKMHQKLPFYGRVVRLMFWPKMLFALRFCDNADRPTFLNRLKARLKAPYFTFTMIGEEIGLGITILLFVKLFVDTLLSLKYYFVKKETYYEYLRKMGVDPDEVRAAVKKIE